MSPSLPDDHPVDVGQAFRLPNRLTGFAQSKDENEERWAVVVAVNSRVSAWLLPRSASSSDGVEVPMEACGAFSKNGVVFYKPRQIVLADLRTYEYGGSLVEPWLSNVVAFYRDHRAREREERLHKRAAGPQRRPRW